MDYAPEYGHGVRRGFFQGLIHNCCSAISSCLYYVCCCWLLEDCFRGARGIAAGGRTGPPSPPRPQIFGPGTGPEEPVGPAPFDLPGPPAGQPGPPGPPSSLLQRPLL